MKTFAPLLTIFVVMFNAAAAEIDFAPAPGSPLKLAGGGPASSWENSRLVKGSFRT